MHQSLSSPLFSAEGIQLFRRAAALLAFSVLGASTYAQGNVLYVDGATGDSMNSGLSWSDPLASPADAFDRIANQGATQREVYVTSGVYYPATINRGISFEVPPDVSVYGSFKLGQPNPASRTNRPGTTVLSGNLGMQNSVADNSYHIVRIVGDYDQPGNEVLLDSLTIRDGNADDFVGSPNSFGGGIYCTDNDLRLQKCFVIENRAARGGGLYFASGVGMFELDTGRDGLRVSLSAFNSNIASRTGGAIHLERYGIPETPSPGFQDLEPSWIMSSQFTKNVAGVATTNTGALQARGGGAIYFGQSGETPVGVANFFPEGFMVANSRFVFNQTWGRGAACRLGAGSFNGGRVSFISCTMGFNAVMAPDFPSGTIWAGNGADTPNGYGDNAQAVNSIIYATTGPDGALLKTDAIRGPGANNNTQQFPDFIGLSAARCCIEQTTPQPTYGDYSFYPNISDDPDFRNPTSGDVRLNAGSPCIDAGFVGRGSLATTYLPDWENRFGTSGGPNNLNPMPYELFGTRPREINQIDMGCHEK